jgi:hypothetical protein
MTGLCMNRLKKSALWLVLVLVLQTMGPALACMMPANGPARHACCQKMAKDCGAAMGSDQSCCRMERSQTPTEPGALFSLESGHELNLVAAAIVPQRDSATAAEWRAVLSAPPPDTSPGKSSVLRI